MKSTISSLRRPAKYVLAAAAAAFVVSFLMKDRLPARDAILPELLQTPVQTSAGLPEPFDVTRKGVTYTVEPLFNYELWGMIVSYHHANSIADISHEAWKDFINVKDVCVLWGKNLETAVYARMKFRNRDFTCFYTYPDEETGRVFTENCLSNNHLLPADPIVAAAVMGAHGATRSTSRAGWCPTGSRTPLTAGCRARHVSTAATAPARPSSSTSSRSCGPPIPNGALSSSSRSCS